MTCASPSIDEIAGDVSIDFQPISIILEVEVWLRLPSKGLNRSRKLIINLVGFWVIEMTFLLFCFWVIDHAYLISLIAFEYIHNIEHNHTKSSLTTSLSSILLSLDFERDSESELWETYMRNLLEIQKSWLLRVTWASSWSSLADWSWTHPLSSLGSCTLSPN